MCIAGNSSGRHLLKCWYFWGDGGQCFLFTLQSFILTFSSLTTEVSISLNKRTSAQRQLGPGTLNSVALPAAHHFPGVFKSYPSKGTFLADVRYVTLLSSVFTHKNTFWGPWSSISAPVKTRGHTENGIAPFPCTWQSLTGCIKMICTNLQIRELCLLSVGSTQSGSCPVTVTTYLTVLFMSSLTYGFELAFGFCCFILEWHMKHKGSPPRSCHPDGATANTFLPSFLERLDPELKSSVGCPAGRDPTHSHSVPLPGGHVLSVKK